MLASLSPRKLRLLTAGVLLCTFAMGAVTGGGIWHWAVAPRLHPLDEELQRGPWSLRLLDLSGEQRARVHDIFERHRPRLDAILRETFPLVRNVHDEIDREIRELLTPEQRAEFDRSKARHHFGPHGLPPPRRGERGEPPPDRP